MSYVGNRTACYNEADPDVKAILDAGKTAGVYDTEAIESRLCPVQGDDFGHENFLLETNEFTGKVEYTTMIDGASLRLYYYKDQSGARIDPQTGMRISARDVSLSDISYSTGNYRSIDLQRLDEECGMYNWYCDNNQSLPEGESQYPIDFNMNGVFDAYSINLMDASIANKYIYATNFDDDGDMLPQKRYQVDFDYWGRLGGIQLVPNNTYISYHDKEMCTVSGEWRGYIENLSCRNDYIALTEGGSIDKRFAMVRRYRIFGLSPLKLQYIVGQNY
jgi:hypothetical protein